jgi:protein gp37
MGEATKIQWTDHTFNPWRGCAKVHTGCTNCYADRQSRRNPGLLGIWGDESHGGTRVVASYEMWRQPVKWNAAAEQAGERRRVFCASLADVFEEFAGQMRADDGSLLWVNEAGEYERQALPGRSDGIFFEQGFKPLRLDDVRLRLFALIDSTPWLDWQLLTKRPENIQRFWWQRKDVEYMPEAGRMNDYGLRRRENVWLGTSVSDQATADAAVPKLLECRDLAPVLFLSAEPLVGPVQLASKGIIPASGDHPEMYGFMIGKDDGESLLQRTAEEALAKSGIDWVIVGGESGPKSRPCQPAWVGSIVEQCKAAGVACFVKQLGANLRVRNCEASRWLAGFKAFPLGETDAAREWDQAFGMVSLRHPKGGDPDEWGEELRVREFPDRKAVAS